MTRVHRVHGDPDRHVGLELRPLGRSAVRTRHAGAGRLARYAADFDTVELNASFYRWPRDTTFASWRQRLPAGFRMSVKAARGLTHARRLYGPE